MYRQYPVYKKLDEIFLGKEKFDIVFLGSSRTKNHINPAVIDSGLAVNSLNMGTAAANIVECKMLLQSYLSNHASPEVVVLTLDLFTLNTEYSLAFYPLYIPYRNLKPVADNLKREGVHVALYNWFPFLSLVELDDYYRGAVLKLALRHAELKNGDFYYKGYESNTMDTIKEGSIPVALKQYEVPVDAQGKKQLNDFVQICLKKRIKLVFTYSPEYKQRSRLQVSNFASTINYCDSVARVYKLPFLQDDLLAICQQPGLFANTGHLNRLGAQVYSRILVKALDSMKLLSNRMPYN